MVNVLVSLSFYVNVRGGEGGDPLGNSVGEGQDPQLVTTAMFIV